MKKFLSLLLATLMLLTAAPMMAIAEEPVTLTIQRSEHASFTYSMNQPVIAALEERLGINIEIQAFSGSDYTTKLNLQLATDDLPDITCSTYTNLASYVPEELFLNLSDYMDQLPNYAATLDRYPDLVNAFKVDGDMYWFIMTAENAPAYGNFPMVRKDVLEAIGWDKTPDNFEELYEMLKAIKEYDPNCIPMVTRGTDVLWRMGSTGICRMPTIPIANTPTKSASAVWPSPVDSTTMPGMSSWTRIPATCMHSGSPMKTSAPTPIPCV